MILHLSRLNALMARPWLRFSIGGICRVFVASPCLVAGRARSSSHLSSAVLSHPFVTNNYSMSTYYFQAFSSIS